ncbi:MAG TPA: metallophosphoesterase [Nocardioidaceae bacterium]|nr:metallophosphoesterase [Nocardioidaceae bacterium]
MSKLKEDAHTSGEAHRRWGRRLGGIVLVLLLGLGGAWLGVLLGGTERQSVGPFDTTMALRPATQGGTTVDTPPLGQLVLDTHDAPVRLQVAVEGLDAAKARKIAANPAMLTGLEDRAAADIRTGLVDLFVRTAVVAVLGAAAAALLVVRRVRAGVVAGVVAMTATGFGYYATWSTWNPDAIQEPRYTGLLTSAPTVVGNARDIVQDFSRYREQLARLVTNVSRLYSTTSTLPVMKQQEDLVKVLHVSDLEIAPQAWDVIATVAHQYDVDVVVDSGDTTDHGSRAENRYLQGVRRVDAPYVWVRGNHDSMHTQRAMQRLPGAVVLNGKPRDVAGLRFLGAGDPRFTPDNSEPVAADSVAAQAQALANVARRDADVDVMVYHDPAPAAVFDGLVPTVLSGHHHRHDADLMPKGTWRLVEGSTGGSGLRALESDTGPSPIELSVLYLDRETAELRAWDHLQLGGLGTASARINREIVDPEREPVTELETPTPTQPVPATPMRRPTMTGSFPTPTPAPTQTPSPTPTQAPSPTPTPAPTESARPEN